MPRIKDAIHLNGALFARVEALYNDRDKLNLDPESKWLLERYYKDFVRAGAKLSDADKTKLKAMNAELAKLQTNFEQNVLKEKNASSIVVDNRADLAGFRTTKSRPRSPRRKRKRRKASLLFRLQNTTGQPALTSLQNRALAREDHANFARRGTVTAANGTRARSFCAR